MCHARKSSFSLVGVFICIVAAIGEEVQNRKSFDKHVAWVNTK